MKKICYRLMVFVVSVLMWHWLQPVPGMCADQSANSPDAVKQMEETIRKQEERIRQLQSEINQKQSPANRQQPAGEASSGKPQAQSREDLIEQALRERWGCCNANSRVVKVADGLVSVYFNNIHDIITFFDTGAEEHARRDLAVFLKKAGIDKGAIEYYSADKRLYAISGSLAAAETVKYY